MSIIVTRPIHFRSRAHGRKVASTTPSPLASLPMGKVPRVARLMALAIRFDRMLRDGEVKSICELARRHQISQPRATQLLNLTLLAPDIQESLLFMTPTVSGRDAVTERDLRPVVAVVEWAEQCSRSSAGAAPSERKSRGFYAFRSGVGLGHEQSSRSTLSKACTITTIGTRSGDVAARAMLSPRKGLA